MPMSPLARAALRRLGLLRMRDGTGCNEWQELCVAIGSQPWPEDDAISPEALAAWGQRIGVELAADHAGQAVVLFAIGSYDHGSERFSLELYAVPRKLVPRWVRESAVDLLVAHNEVPLLDDGLDVVSDEEGELAAWLLHAFCPFGAPATLPECVRPAKRVPDLRAHAVSAGPSIGAVRQIITMSFTRPYDEPTGQDLAGPTRADERDREPPAP
jgi:hypothetical protein